MMLLSQRSDQWNFRYPEGKPFEQRFAKINLVPDNQDTSLAGMAMGLLYKYMMLVDINIFNQRLSSVVYLLKVKMTHTQILGIMIQSRF